MKTAKEMLRAIKIELGMSVELATMKLEDGVTIIEAEVFEAGQPVMIVTEDEQKIPLPVNEEGYVLEDGMLLIVTETGVIAEIKEKATEEEAPETEEEVAASEKPTTTPVAKKVVEAVTKETHFSSEDGKNEIPNIVLEVIAKVVDDKLEAFKTELQAEKEEVELSEVKPITHNPNSVELKEAPKGLVAFLNSRK